MKIALIGTFPPPIGGTSIHIMRLREKLIENGYIVNTYDTNGTGDAKGISGVKNIKNYKKWILSYFFKMNEDIAHSHTHEWKERALLSVAASIHRKKSIFTFHSLREEYSSLSAIQKKCVRIVFKKASLLICTSESIKEKLISWGCSDDKLVTITPFITPSRKEVEAELPKEIVAFKNTHDFIICGNASNNNHFADDDLYGLDMAIELIKHLKEKCHNAGLIFGQTKITDKNYFSDIRNRIKEYGLENDVLITQDGSSLIPIIAVSDIFIRPTNTDSWPLSICEALSLGITVIASDVCQRPLGCALFKNRNQQDFNQVVEEHLKKHSDNVNLILESGDKEIMEEYQKVVGNEKI